MIGYVTVGADDIPRAERFYSAFLPELGYALDVSVEGLSYVIPVTPDQQHEPADFYVKPPYDGQAASVGNGAMVAFKVQTQALVRKLFAAAVAAGGRNEGAPNATPASRTDETYLPRRTTWMPPASTAKAGASGGTGGLKPMA